MAEAGSTPLEQIEPEELERICRTALKATCHWNGCRPATVLLDDASRLLARVVRDGGPEAYDALLRAQP